MKKLILLCFVVFVLLCGCSNKDTASKPDIKINIPHDNKVNGYRIEESENNPPAETLPDVIKGKDTAIVSDINIQNNNSFDYCGNKNSKVFHSSSCGSVADMKEENKIFLKDRNEYISQGYKPCNRCKP